MSFKPDLPDDVEQLVRSGRHGLEMWARVELRDCSEHLKLVGQPLCHETAALWLERRAAGRCPISDGCPRPELGRIFCRNHSRYNKGSETC